MLNKALGVIQKGKKHIIETTKSNQLKKREAKKGALSSIFGRGVVDDVYTKANQITQAGKQAFTERLQSPAPVRMNAKETLVTKPLKVTKDIAQGFAYGAGFLTKSAVQAVGGDKLRQKYDNPAIETMLFGRPTKTLQDFSKQTGKYAEEKGSSPRQKATLQGLAVAGSLFVENPLNFSKTPAKKLFTELAQETNEQVIKQQVRDNFVDLTDDMIESIAPRIAKATNEKEVVDIVNNADSFVNKGVDTDPLILEAKKYKSAEEFVKAQSLYHGTPNELEGGVLKFGGGKQLKKGGYMGGHFLTDTPEIAKNFSFGGKVYQASGGIKNKVFDVNANKKLVQDFIGKKYKMDDEMVEFTKQDYEQMFPNGEADWSTVNREALETIAKEQGKIGIAIPEYAAGEKGTTYQIFDDNIPVYTKSQLEEIWKKANVSSEPSIKKADDKNLIAMHNLSEDNLRYTDKVGGLPVPSLAVARKEYPIDSFGEVSLIGNKELIDPRNKTNKAFNADVYSKRVPQTVVQVNNIKPIEKTINESKDYFDNLDLPVWRNNDSSPYPLVSNIESNGLRGMKYDFIMQRAFGASKKIDPKSTRMEVEDFANANRQEYNEFVENIYNQIEPDEQIFKGFTNSGRRRYIPANLENFVKEMKGSVQDTEGFGYGVPSLRASQAKKFNSLEAMKKDRNKIIPKDEMEALGEETIREFDSIVDKYPDIPSLGSLLLNLKDFTKNKISRSNFMEWSKIPSEAVDELVVFAKKLKDMPTGYFEVKPQRAVGINEFKIAVVPKNASLKTREILERKGLTLREYDPKIPNDRARAIREATEEEDLAFKLSKEKKMAYESTVKEIQSDLKRIFGKNVPIEAIDDVALMSDPRAVGELSNGVIKLLTDNGKVSDLVGKHESWHFFKRVLASKNERLIAKNIEDDLIKAFPNKYKKLEEAGYSKNRIAEELVADEFARYYRTGKSFSEKVRVFFDKMLQKFELLMANKQELLTYFKNIKQRVGAITQKDIDTVSFKLDGKGPKPVDRLIAEGKIRVVSRDGRDVYQTKQRGKWVNARDEESAVAKVTKTAVEKPKAVIPEKLENERMMIEFQKDELKRDPARTLTKYMNKNGELPEVSGSGTSQFARKGDDIAKELGYEDSESARIAAQEYLERKKTILAEEKALKSEIKEVKKKSIIEIASQKQSPKPRITPEEVKSIEKQAQQAQEIMDSDFRKQHDVSLPTIVKQTVTPVTRKVHLIDTLFTTPKFVMEKIGFGKEVKELRRAMDNYWKELPKNLDVITDWSKRVSKESNQKIFRYLDGQKVALNPKELEVAGEIKVWLKQWADRLGLKEENRVTDYITRLFDNDMAKEFDEELAKIIADKIPGSVYSPFVLKRLGAKGYIEDTWKALDAYVKRSTRKVHMDPMLDRIQTKTGSSLEFANIEESQFRYIQKYIENINMRPTNVDKSIDNFIKNIPFIGNKFGQRPVTAITKFFRQMTYRGMLGLNPGSAIRNLSQGINTYAVLGEKYTVLGYAKLFNKGSMKELVDEGVLNAGFVQDKVLSATKKKIEMLDKGLFAMFETVERINRGAAYFGAKSKALKQGKSLEEAIEYAKDIVRKTQFVFDSVDSPVGMSSDIMKTLFQFQTFTTKQIEFLGGMIKDKNVKGLTRYTLAGLAFVYTIGQAIGMEPKEILPMYRFKTPPSLKFPVEVAKAGLDAPDKYGKDRDLKTKAKDVFKSGIGLFPGGTQIKKTLEGLGAIKDGGSFDSAGRLQFEIGDTKKDKIQAILFGKYPTKEAKEYFDKIESGDKVTKKDRKLYEAIQEIKATDPEQALESYKNLTDEEKASYQAYKKQLDTEKKTELKKNIFPVFQEIRKLKEEGKEQEALDAYKALTPEERESYQSIKKSMDNLEKQQDKVQAERTFVKLLVDYTRAYAIDPSNAFKAMTTKEKLGTVKGNLVGFERFFGKQFNKEGGSEEYMYKLLEEMDIPASERSNYNLEHIVPLTAGGDNSPENLKVVDRATHNSWTEIDIALGRALKDKKINRKRAEKIAIDFKSGLINKEEVLKLIK